MNPFLATPLGSPLLFNLNETKNLINIIESLINKHLNEFHLVQFLFWTTDEGLIKLRFLAVHNKTGKEILIFIKPQCLQLFNNLNFKLTPRSNTVGVFDLEICDAGEAFLTNL